MFVRLAFFPSLANEASWPSITKNASDWRAVSPEQVEPALHQTYVHIIISGKNSSPKKLFLEQEASKK